MNMESICGLAKDDDDVVSPKTEKSNNNKKSDNAKSTTETKKSSDLDPKWEQHFAQYPYASVDDPYAVSAKDIELLAAVKEAPKTPHFTRWYQHVTALKVANKM